MLVGDTSFGESYQVAIAERGGRNILIDRGWDYPLKLFRAVLADADYVVANLESVLTGRKVSPYTTTKKYIHYESAEHVLPVLDEYNFDVFCLANNHSVDFGIPGLLDTFRLLHENGFTFFGAGANETEAAQPLLLDCSLASETIIKIALFSGFEYNRQYAWMYAAYADDMKAGSLSLSSKLLLDKISSMKKHEPDRFIILFPHWGNNYEWKTEEQDRLAATFLDAGVDLIVGHGAHTLQELEWHGGHWVVYNLGNFMFNSPGRYDKKKALPYSLLARLILSEHQGKVLKQLLLYPLFTNNRQSNYQGRFVTRQEFQTVHTAILEQGRQKEILAEKLKKGHDNFGYYLQLALN